MVKNDNIKKQITELIYNKNNQKQIPDYYANFNIVSPEHSPHEVEVKTYPQSVSKNIFALIWDIHSSGTVSSTIVPSPTPFVYEKNITNGMRTQMHSHEYLELFYVIDGEYHQKILGREYVFQKGELCLIDKNCHHQEILDDGSSTILFIGITSHMFNEMMTHLSNAGRINSFLNTAILEQKNIQQYLHFKPSHDEESCLKLENTLMSLIDELKKYDDASPFICQGLLLRIFKILGTKYDFSLSKQTRKKMNMILFEEITQFITENLADISIQMLVSEFHFQKDYFNRLLKTQTGMTYTEYIQLLRLRHAEKLLLTTDYTIEQVAEMIGYHNKGYFYRLFTEKYSLTPAQFKKKCLKFYI